MARLNKIAYVYVIWAGGYLFVYVLCVYYHSFIYLPIFYHDPVLKQTS